MPKVVDYSWRTRTGLLLARDTGTDVPRTYVPRYRCSPVPRFPGTYMFPEPMFPGTDVPRYRCSPVPMFPRNLYRCSPVPMFPEPMFPGTYVPRFTAHFACVWVRMCVRLGDGSPTCRSACVRVCVRVCVRACERVCACVCVHMHVLLTSLYYPYY